MNNKRFFMAVFLGICFLFSGLTVVFAAAIDTDSKITDVTIYQDTARVTREAKVDLLPGTHTILFKNIVPYIDESSITVSGQGTAKAKIFGGYIEQKFLANAADKRREELQGKIQEVDDQLAMISNEQKILNEKDAFLQSVRLFAGQQIPKELVTTMPPVANLTDTITFIDTQYHAIETSRQDLKLKGRDLQKQRQALEDELNNLNSGGQTSKRVIAVDLECEIAGSLTVRVAYMAQGASWRPIYDARTAYKEGSVDLTLFGMVRQSTGEDWENVNLTLSTAKPSLGGRMPYVAPWFLNEIVQSTRREGGMMKALSGRVMQSAAMEVGEQYDAHTYNADARYNMAMPASAPAEVAYAEAVQQGVSVVYQIARPVTIKSDGKESRFPVTAQKLKADFSFTSYPRLSLFAYLGSRVINAPDLQLLAGEVNLFLEGDYIGKSSIDNIGPGQDFDLYLGVDENVKIKRDEISRKVDDVMIGGIPSPNRKTTIQNKLTVENFKPTKAKIILFEAMPVSQTERIKTKVYDVSEEPVVKDWKDRKGIWRWEFELEPKQKKEIKYTVVIEHPRDLVIGGLE